MKRKIMIIGMLALVLSFALSTINCVTEERPYSAAVVNSDNVIVKDGNIAVYANSRDFIAKTYASASRNAAQEGYTKVLHWETVKLGPFGIFGKTVILTAVKP